VLLTRLPLPLRGVRLACVRPAASVRSEPGSNSQVVMRICYPAGHYIFDESQAHLLAAQKNRKHDELRYVTARVISSTALTRSAIRKDPADHVSLSSDLNVKQHNSQRSRACALRHENHRPSRQNLPGGPGPRNSRNEIRVCRFSGAAVDGRFIKLPAPNCQHAFSQKVQKRLEPMVQPPAKP
jgi:hypothetical protein